MQGIVLAILWIVMGCCFLRINLPKEEAYLKIKKLF